MGIQVGQTRLVLASASPRRRQLLEQLGMRFEVQPAEIDEAFRPGEHPRAYVERIARRKAEAGARRAPGAIVLAADTTVAIGERILGKPMDAIEAEMMLTALSGREHAVLTAVALGGALGGCTVETRVHFRALSHEEIAWYVATGEPLDKAGAYAIQGAGGAWVTRIEGSASNVIGLPLVETLDLLKGVGVALPWTQGA
jgi:nucleoside triphosphate pyrophosphatase